MESELRTFAHALAAGDLDVVAPATDEGVAMTGEVLRGVLQRAAAEGEIRRLQDLPWGVGSMFRQGAGVPSVGSPGVFLACRTTPAKGNVRYWRFVTDDGEVIGDDAEILRRIDPGSTPTHEGPVDLEAVWRLAVDDIVTEHNRRADPRAAATQPGPAQQHSLDILRDPAVALPEGAEDADEALTVERSSAVRHALSGIRADVEAERISRNEAAVRIVDTVKEFGLQPVAAPELLPEISEDDVGVVCWMGVLPST